MTENLNFRLATVDDIDQLVELRVLMHLGATRDGVSLYIAAGFTEPRFVNLEKKFVKS